MKLHAFVFNWRGHTPLAQALEHQIGRFTPVTVINSDEEAVAAHPHWVHLGEDAYFTAQWNKAVELFSGDLLFHMQADASFSDAQALLARVSALFERLPLGVYEPDINFNAMNYDRKRLVAVERHLYQVPLTDCTCWCIHRDVVRSVPPVDASINKYGWGICAAIAAAAQMQNKLCVRDYSLRVRHPRTRGYPSDLAANHGKSYFEALPSPLREKSVAVCHEMNRAMVKQDRNMRGIRSFLSWRALRGKLVGARS